MNGVRGSVLSISLITAAVCFVLVLGLGILTGARGSGAGGEQTEPPAPSSTTSGSSSGSTTPSSIANPEPGTPATGTPATDPARTPTKARSPEASDPGVLTVRISAKNEQGLSVPLSGSDEVKLILLDPGGLSGPSEVAVGSGETRLQLRSSHSVLVCIEPAADGWTIADPASWFKLPDGPRWCHPIENPAGFELVVELAQL